MVRGGPRKRGTGRGKKPPQRNIREVAVNPRGSKAALPHSSSRASGWGSANAMDDISARTCASSSWTLASLAAASRASPRPTPAAPPRAAAPRAGRRPPPRPPPAGPRPAHCCAPPGLPAGGAQGLEAQLPQAARAVLGPQLRMPQRGHEDVAVLRAVVPGLVLEGVVEAQGAARLPAEKGAVGHPQPRASGGDEAEMAVELRVRGPAVGLQAGTGR
ncbi:unnamed protein product [Prorocentrum cordatum]|uniref:Uncharacterized protein n=1 Tax=Prorocentrum cordatum TaxID=2364126 RepID=A0ABN9RPD7_9DINO|nr:unnamed protein product [Polarella glacialis]